VAAGERGVRGPRRAAPRRGGGPHSFQKTVYAYYRAHGRRLPWRETDDPYRILVAEVMLQQTQVPRVLAKYPEFIAAFPDVQSLATAPLSEVLRVWQGLGYNRRARHLKEAASIIVRDYGGQVPDSMEELRRLPGIGHATAAQILAFAYNKPVVFIETNIRAVFIHHFFAVRESVRDSEILPLVEATLDRENPREWYYALFDYGVYLKKTHGNPARRSAHHVKQSPFEGSNREARSRVLAEILASQGISIEDLSIRTGYERERLDVILSHLEKDRLIVRCDGLCHIAEDNDEPVSDETPLLEAQ
jgi:A/G-specific adenine glycosylase